MNRLEGILRPMVMILFAVITICVFVLGNTQSVFGQEKKEDVSGTVFQFGERGTYELSSAGKNFSTDFGIVSGGKFSITGNISSVSQRDGYPAYAVSKGNLHFSYSFATDLMNKSMDERHLIDDRVKVVNGTTVVSEIKRGALLLQTSKDGQVWFDVPGETYTNIFQGKPDSLHDFYTTTNVQMVNGCYYRVIVAYMTEVRTQKAQIFPPKFEKYERNKFAEVYSFYAYDETAIRTSIPESTNRRNLGKKDRTERAGYAGKVTMNNGDPHFGWEIGQFFVGGFTDYENDANGDPIFLKNNGDRISLWFELDQNIDQCYGNSAIKVIADREGSDAYFEVPGGVNETIDFGRGALIVRKTNSDSIKEEPQIYTNYLEASASMDAVTKVDLMEEGDYEVALDYAVQFDKTRILGYSILPEIAKYRVSFKFSVRNGNSMVFLRDQKTGSELAGGAITENGFRIDTAGSKYLQVNVKREVLKDGFDGLTEDTRFNSWAADGDVFTEEGVYTITVTNRDLENIEPTVKRVYVGNNNILKAYMVNNISIAEIEEKLAVGATIAEDGTIIEPVPETLAEPPSVEETSTEDSTDNNTENNAEEETEQVINDSAEEQQKKNSFPGIPVSLAAMGAVAGGVFVKSRRKNSTGGNMGKEN